jgi:hypothetical protein
MITAGTITKLLLYDVAEEIDVKTVANLVGTAMPGRAGRKPQPPTYVEYTHPPVSFDGEAIGEAEIDGFRVRVKVFDYGVVSLALSRPAPHAWNELVSGALRWYDDPGLSAAGERFCRVLLKRVAPAVSKPRDTFLDEDYLVIIVNDYDDASTTSELLAARGTEIAQLLRGEHARLSDQERDEVLRHRLSYLATDLVVPTWNAAFVCDTEANARDILEILEFANSQLLEFRYYDRRLDEELERIYARLQKPGWSQTWFGRRYTRAARQVHAFFIDVNELTDKAENAWKIAGDVYAARLFTLVAARLGLDHWKGNVREKLKTMDDIYRFAVEQTGMARGQLLELAIVAILVFELILFFAGVMK